jgi:ssDNA-binding Zn-finger/Zn-ribbon topoisomerase 1
MVECDRDFCDGSIEKVEDDYYECDTCNEPHMKIGFNFVYENADIVEEISFAKCDDCNGTLYKTQSGRDIYLRCSGCSNQSRFL